MSKRLRHGHARRGQTTPTYNTWTGMLHRADIGRKGVTPPCYKGVGVCKRWFKFENFLTDMGEKPEGLSIDRINGALGYSKKNCRWATPVVQSRNQKIRSDNKSGCRGVVWHKAAGKWLARIALGGKHINLGLFVKKSDAIEARKKGEALYWK